MLHKCKLVYVKECVVNYFNCYCVDSMSLFYNLIKHIHVWCTCTLYPYIHVHVCSIYGVHVHYTHTYMYMYMYVPYMVYMYTYTHTYMYMYVSYMVYMYTIPIHTCPCMFGLHVCSIHGLHVHYTLNLIQH